MDVLKPLVPNDVALEKIDFVDQDLRVFDEPGIPTICLSPTPHYTHEQTRKWSAVIKPYDAFGFTTPQYNWSIPSSQKNALDFLHSKWSGKSSAICSYITRGGARATLHLRDIV